MSATTDQMTSRERWLAALELRPVDRLPFWPKITAAYARLQREPYSAMGFAELFGYIGADGHYGVSGSVSVSQRTASVDVMSDGLEQRRTYNTSSGSMTDVRRSDPVTGSSHPMEYPIKTRADIRLMTEFYEDSAVQPDAKGVASARDACKNVGDRGVTAESVATSPLMRYIQDLAGIENGHILLQDYPDEVRALFEAMHRVNLQKVTIAAEHSPADLLYLIENTSTTLISPTQYRELCLPHLRDYCDAAAKAGRKLVLHMCGHIRCLLPDLSTLPVMAFEALTIPTVGDTSLSDARIGCPDTCLIGGTSAALWIRPTRSIIDGIYEQLDSLSHHRGIVMSSAGEMPPKCPPESIKEVCTAIRGYRVRG